MVALLSLWLTACFANGPEHPPAVEPAVVGAYREVDAIGLKGNLDAGKVPVLVDVRTAQEFASGHVKGSVHIPVDQLKGRLSELETYKGQDVYVICRSGNRSRAASITLVDAGFAPINVAGGVVAWQGAGYPTE